VGIERQETGGPLAAAVSLPRRLHSPEALVLGLTLAYFLALWPFTPALATPRNLGNLVTSMVPLLIVAVGQTFVLVTGGIDLSVTSIVALTSVVGGSIMTADGGLLAGSAAAAPAGVAAMLLLGIGLGALNGLAVTRLAMPPFLVTLTAMMFLSGLAIRFTESEAYSDLPPSIHALATDAPFAVRLPWITATIPYSVILAALLGVFAHFTLRRTLFGRWLFAVGMNRKAARISGVPVERTTLLAYAASGLSGALASILYTGRLETASPVHGQTIFLDVIGAAVIGGTSLFGGRGTVAGTALGVLFITLIDNSLNLLGRSTFEIAMAKGAVILLAAIADAARARLRDAARPG